MANNRYRVLIPGADNVKNWVTWGRGSPANDLATYGTQLAWLTNDLAFDTDHTTAAVIYKCASGGTPGTWTEIDGGTGTPGLNAFTTTTASFTMPAVSSSVTVAVAQSTFMAVGQVLFVFGAGFFQVASVPDSTHTSLTNLGYSGNASPTSTIATAAKVSPSGLIGATGAAGAAGGPGTAGTNGRDAFTTTTSNFTQPPVGSNVTVPVANGLWMVINQIVFVFGGGYYQVVSSGLSSCLLNNLGYAGNLAPAATVASSAGVSPAGIRGPGSGLGVVQFGTFITAIGTGSGQWIGTGGVNDSSNSPLILPIADPLGAGATMFDLQFWINVYTSVGTLQLQLTDATGTLIGPFTVLTGVGGPRQLTGPLGTATSNGGIGIKVSPFSLTSPGALDIRAVVTLS